ncbi:tyrosine-type recombinase/integrase [Serratia marcescens]|uniref:tyrosine-type recombinase/integrase n=1 Tax=Serratia marcescens TaxID=615 RepID=UPI0013D9C070|nr:integrase family protein [Serratia marcescens]
MESFKFTKAKLIGLPPAPKGKQVEYRDDHVKGLRLRIGASGVKTFCAVKKVNGKFIRTALGRFPELSIERARTIALETLGDIGVTGRNPNEVKRENAAAAVTLSEAMDLYINTRGSRLKDTTAKQYKRMLANFSGDWLNRQMANITRDDVLMRHKAITEGRAWFGSDVSTMRSGVASGSKSQADLWARSLRAIYNFAYDNYRNTEGIKLLPEPPTVVLSTKRQWHGTTRKNTRIRNNDLGRWLRAVATVRDNSLLNRDDHAVSVCDALDMALFTGLRRSEIFNLEWNKVNLAGGYFWIDKTKNGDPLELPITKTLKIIFERRFHFKNDGDKFVFKSARGGVITDPRRVIDKIISNTVDTPNIGNLKAIAFTCHDARRTYATIAELSGVGTYILKRLMNHKTGRSSDVTQGYISLPVEEIIEPATVIEKKILTEAGLLNVEDSVDDELGKVLSKMSAESKKRLIDILERGDIK